MFCTLRTAPKIVLQSLRRMERGLGTGKEERIERACVGWLGRENFLTAACTARESYIGEKKSCARFQRIKFYKQNSTSVPLTEI